MSLRLRIFLVFLFVIAASLLLTLALVQRSIEAEGTSRIEDALKVGKRVFIDKLETKLISLERNTKLIANDDALRQAVFDDPRTLNITLNNFLLRLSEDSDAEFMWLLDTDANIIASAGSPHAQGDFTHDSLLTLAEEQGWSTTAIASINDSVFSLSVVGFFIPVRAPVPSFWLVTGEAFSNEVATELANLTGLELILLDTKTGTPKAFSMESSPQSLESKAPHEIPDNLTFDLEFSDTYFLGQRIEVRSAPTSPTSVLLLKSSDDIRHQISDLNTQLSISGVVILFFATLITAYLSKSIAQPLLQLVSLAKSIGRGQYQEISINQKSEEIRTLASAFSHMQMDIAQRQKEIEYVAYHDDLTGLPNRNAFVQVLESYIKRSENQRFAVFVLDFDRFKEINDTLGHHNGDRVLREFSERISSLESDDVYIARIGGDEFAVLVKNTDQIEPVFEKLHQQNQTPIEIERIALELRTSTGISIYPDHGQSPNSLLQTAEIAMYLAKEEHKNRTYYEKSRDPHSMQRLTLIAELKSAIDRQQFELYYQPKLNIKDNQYQSVECLIRWIHPSFGFINPEEFIGYAEQTGVIKHLTRWVINTALLQAKDWQNKGYNIRVAVNISAIDLTDADFPDFVINQLKQYELPSSVVTLEITEGAVMRDVEESMRALHTLDNYGVSLSIDDYGQGYSSMAQLKRLPVQELKIDKAFVLNLTEDSDDMAIVKSTIELAHNMGLRVVAEGIENQHSLSILESFGCEYAQGFYLSRPLDVNKMAQWIEENDSQIAKV